MKIEYFKFHNCVCSGIFKAIFKSKTSNPKIMFLYITHVGGSDRPIGVWTESSWKYDEIDSSTKISKQDAFLAAL